MKSLDPRVNRLSIQENMLQPKAAMDQFGTYEVFTQLKEDKPFLHTGVVHAPNEEMAFLFAKEQFSRRQTCTGLFVTDTRNVFVSPFTEGDTSVYELVPDEVEVDGSPRKFELFHQNKRGKQHEHIGSLEASSYEQALVLAKPEFIHNKPVYNIWVINSNDILFIGEEDKIIWDTLPEKKFREAIDYKASDKIKEYKERNKDG
jgi:ring-1,2-phenylacetyl-CoA epoxidase subunit PaaB